MTSKFMIWQFLVNLPKALIRDMGNSVESQLIQGNINKQSHWCVIEVMRGLIGDPAEDHAGGVSSNNPSAGGVG